MHDPAKDPRVDSAPVSTGTAGRKEAAPLQSMPSHLARDLCDEEGLAHIVLDGAVYTLRITRSSKLILTK
ncbi:MAG: hemin uptake protein HemP [Tropicimonas sp.]|uniref:hemin uptake protein HemP n=1 Tax=Tropicimonas sp. TaxID=2067044 RepID=UPI003A88D61B